MKEINEIIDSKPTSFLVELFEAIVKKLNLRTITAFAKAKGLSYNGVRFNKNPRVKVGETKYIVDSDEK
jgi:hypothetical protein